MDALNRYRLKKYSIYSLIVIAASLLQNVGGLFLQIGSARAFLLIPVCICLTMDEDEKGAALIGLLGGMLWDLTSLDQMGFNAIFIMAACFISSSFVTYILRKNFLTTMVFSLFFIFLHALLYWLFFVVFKGTEGAQMSIFYFYIPCAVYTAVLTPLIYFIFRPLKRKLKKENSYQ